MLSQNLFFSFDEIYFIKYIFIFLLSFFACFFIIYLSRKYPSFLDKNFKGYQKYHTFPTPRLGGVGIYISSFVGLISSNIFLKLIFSSSLAFVSGIFSDINKELSPKVRILFISISAFLGIFLTNFYINNLDFVTLNKFLGILLTFIGILGFTNAINIIDGFNGLAGGFSLIALLNFLFTAFFITIYF